MKTSNMEHSELDRLIREKMQLKSDIHAQERDRAKPFIWTAIQTNFEHRQPMRWYHLAAAVLLLIFSFAFIYQRLNIKHENKLARLSEKLEYLQERVQKQNSSVISKDHQIKKLMAKLDQVDMLLVELQQEKPVVPQKQIIYKTDTVFVQTVKYINQEKIDFQSRENFQTSERVSSRTTPDIEYAIYPSNGKWRQSSKSEAIKIKIGNQQTIQN